MATAPRRAVALAAKIAVLTVVLSVTLAVGSRFLPATQAATVETARPTAGSFATVLGVLLLQTVALACPVVRSRWHGWRLAGTMFVVYFGATTFLSQVESLLYLGRHMSPALLRGLFLMGLFSAAVFSPILVLVLGRWKPGSSPAGGGTGARLAMPLTTWVWRLMLGAGVFTSLYYLFGYYLAWKNPAVRAYYGGTDPGSFLAQMAGIVRGTPWMLPLQFVRGLAWVLLALPVISTMKGAWWEAGLAVALLFTAPTAYLLFPNPVMPEPVRMAHLFETAPYQFLFGWFVVWLLTRQPRHGPALLRRHDGSRVS